MRLLLLALFASGCAVSHGIGEPPPTADGGPTGCGGGPTVICFEGCSDAGRAPICVGGAWECPPGTSTTPPSDCCWGPSPRPGDCACISGRWICEGPDAGPFACPSDPSALVGASCSGLSGTSCGTCDPCGPCNQAYCDGSTWVVPPEIELPCPVDDRFACGPTTTCERSLEVCNVYRSDVVGWPDTYSCGGFPASCSPGSGCGCFPASEPAGLCHDDGMGGITVEFPGG